MKRLTVALCVLVLVAGSGTVATTQPDSPDDDGVALLIARRCLNRNVTIHGNPEADTIIGTPNSDVIKAGKGDDVVFAGGGKDFICGNKGSDTIVGGDGHDTADGGRGADTCEAEVRKKCEGVKTDEITVEAK